MHPTNYPDYVESLEALGLMARFDNITIDDTKRAAGGSYQGRGFNIGMPGSFDNIKHLTTSTIEPRAYLEKRPGMKVVLGAVFPSVIAKNDIVFYRTIRPIPRNAELVTISAADAFAVDYRTYGVDHEPIQDSGGTTNEFYICKSFGNIVKPIRQSDVGNTIKVSMTPTGQSNRMNNQRIKVTFKFKTWEGYCEKTIYVYVQSSTRTVTLLGQTPTVTTDAVEADLTFSNFAAHPDASAYPSSENVPFTFDVAFTNSEAGRQISLDYEMEADVRLS